uniref:myomegalin-like isoform X3 n=1 Tax=Myxine glutinosa TaxID=7769 RepID=UPI00358EBC65
MAHRNREGCRICGRELCGTRRRWLFHARPGRAALHTVLAHATRCAVSRGDGLAEFACSKCAFMLEQVYRYDTVMARVQALSIEHLRRLAFDKARLLHCIAYLHGRTHPGCSCVMEPPTVDDCYNALLQKDMALATHEWWWSSEENGGLAREIPSGSLKSYRAGSSEPWSCRSCRALRVPDAAYESVCHVPRHLAIPLQSCPGACLLEEEDGWVDADSQVVSDGEEKEFCSQSQPDDRLPRQSNYIETTPCDTHLLLGEDESVKKEQLIADEEVKTSTDVLEEEEDEKADRVKGSYSLVALEDEEVHKFVSDDCDHLRCELTFIGENGAEMDAVLPERGQGKELVSVYPSLDGEDIACLGTVKEYGDAEQPYTTMPNLLKIDEGHKPKPLHKISQVSGTDYEACAENEDKALALHGPVIETLIGVGEQTTPEEKGPEVPLDQTPLFTVWPAIRLDKANAVFLTSLSHFLEGIHFRPVVRPQGSKIPSAERVCYRPQYSRLETLMPSWSWSVCAQADEDLLPCNLIDDLFEDFIPIKLKHVSEERQEEANNSEERNRLVSALEQAQSETLSLWDARRTAEAANQALLEKLAQKEEKMKVQEQNILKRDKAIQGLTMALRAKDKEMEELCIQIEEKDGALVSARDLAHKAQMAKFQGTGEHQALLNEKQEEELQLHACLLQCKGQLQAVSRELARRTQELAAACASRDSADVERDETLSDLHRCKRRLQELRETGRRQQAEASDREYNLSQRYDTLLAEEQRQRQSQELLVARLSDSLKHKDSLLQEYLEMLKSPSEQCEDGTSVLISKLRERLKDREQAREREFGDQAMAVQEKEKEISELRLTLRERESNLERMQCLLRDNEASMTSLDEIIREKDKELQHLATAYKDLQRERRRLEEEHTSTLADMDSLTTQQCSMLDILSRDLQEARAALLDRSGRAVEETTQQLILRLSEREQLLQEVLNEKQLQKERHTFEMHCLQERLQQQHISDDTSCQGSSDDWMSRQLELERMRVLLKEKDVIIKKLVNSGHGKDQLLDKLQNQAGQPHMLKLQQTFRVRTDEPHGQLSGGESTDVSQAVIYSDERAPSSKSSRDGSCGRVKRFSRHETAVRESEEQCKLRKSLEELISENKRLCMALQAELKLHAQMGHEGADSASMDKALADICNLWQQLEEGLAANDDLRRALERVLCETPNDAGSPWRDSTLCGTWDETSYMSIQLAEAEGMIVEVSRLGVPDLRNKVLQLIVRMKELQASNLELQSQIVDYHSTNQDVEQRDAGVQVGNRRLPSSGSSGNRGSGESSLTIQSAHQEYGNESGEVEWTEDVHERSGPDEHTTSSAQNFEESSWGERTDTSGLEDEEVFLDGKQVKDTDVWSWLDEARQQLGEAQASWNAVQKQLGSSGVFQSKKSLFSEECTGHSQTVQNNGWHSLLNNTDHEKTLTSMDQGQNQGVSILLAEEGFASIEELRAELARLRVATKKTEKADLDGPVREVLEAHEPSGALEQLQFRVHQAENEAALFKRQLELNDRQGSFNPEIIMAMAHEIERLKIQVQDTSQRGSQDLTVSSKATNPETVKVSSTRSITCEAYGSSVSDMQQTYQRTIYTQTEPINNWSESQMFVGFNLVETSESHPDGTACSPRQSESPSADEHGILKDTSAVQKAARQETGSVKFQQKTRLPVPTWRKGLAAMRAISHSTSRIEGLIPTLGVNRPAQVAFSAEDLYASTAQACSGGPCECSSDCYRARREVQRLKNLLQLQLGPRPLAREQLLQGLAAQDYDFGHAQECKGVQVEAHDLGYETCGRSETEDCPGAAPGTGQSSRRPSPLCDLSGEGVDVHELRRQVHILKAQLMACKSASSCNGRALTDEACSSNLISGPAALTDGFLGQASRVRRVQEAEAEIQELVKNMEDLQAQLTESKGLNRHLQEQLDSLHAANGEASLVQAQARELCALRQKLREASRAGGELHASLSVLTTALEDLLGDRHMDYYPGQGVREQLAASRKLLSSLQAQLDSWDDPGGKNASSPGKNLSSQSNVVLLQHEVALLHEDKARISHDLRETSRAKQEATQLAAHRLHKELANKDALLHKLKQKFTIRGLTPSASHRSCSSSVSEVTGLCSRDHTASLSSLASSGTHSPTDDGSLADGDDSLSEGDRMAPERKEASPAQLCGYYNGKSLQRSYHSDADILDTQEQGRQAIRGYSSDLGHLLLEGGDAFEQVAGPSKASLPPRPLPSALCHFPLHSLSSCSSSCYCFPLVSAPHSPVHTPFFLSDLQRELGQLQRQLGAQPTRALPARPLSSTIPGPQSFGLTTSILTSSTPVLSSTASHVGLLQASYPSAPSAPTLFHSFGPKQPVPCNAVHSAQHQSSCGVGPLVGADFDLGESPGTSGLSSPALAQQASMLQQQLQGERELNESLRVELELQRSVLAERNGPAWREDNDTGQQLDASPESSGYNSSRLTAGLLEEHLREIKALRERLEESISNNDLLRQQLQLRLAETQPDNHESTKNVDERGQGERAKWDSRFHRSLGLWNMNKEEETWESAGFTLDTAGEPKSGVRNVGIENRIEGFEKIWEELLKKEVVIERKKVELDKKNVDMEAVSNILEQKKVELGMLKAEFKKEKGMFEFEKRNVHAVKEDQQREHELLKKEKGNLEIDKGTLEGERREMERDKGKLDWEKKDLKSKKKELQREKDEMRRCSEDLRASREEATRLQGEVTGLAQQLAATNQMLHSLRIQLHFYERLGGQGGDAKPTSLASPEASLGKARTAKHHSWSTRASEPPLHTDELHLLLLEMRKLRVQLDRSERANHELRVRLELQLQGSPPTTQTGSETGTRRSPQRSAPIIAENINVPSCLYDSHPESSQHKETAPVMESYPTPPSSASSCPALDGTPEVPPLKPEVSKTGADRPPSPKENGMKSAPSVVLTHVLALAGDYDRVRQQLAEARLLVRAMESRLRDRLARHKEPETRVSKWLCVSVNTMKGQLDNAARLLKLFWRTSLPEGPSGYLEDGDKADHISHLRMKLSEQEKMLQCTVSRLRASNQLKDSIEKTVIRQLTLTHDVLRTARCNLEPGHQTLPPGKSRVDSLSCFRAASGAASPSVASLMSSIPSTSDSSAFMQLCLEFQQD